jgi:hypothetical protein
MRKSTSFFLLLIILASCRHRELSLQELQKRDWDSLDKGVYYLSRQSQPEIQPGHDSIELNLKGVNDKDINSLEISPEEMPSLLKDSLIVLVRHRLRNSRSGYLKVDPYTMFRRIVLKASIDLFGDYPQQPGFGADSAALVAIPGIRSATFVSKEEAKKKYLEDGNQDWEGILDENPLPNSIDISLQENDWTEESMKELERQIMIKLVNVSQLNYSQLITKRSETYLYFSYDWK